MFTGLVEEMGQVLEFYQDAKTQQWIVVLKATLVVQGCTLGDSIAVNGVCLTVTAFTSSQFTVGLSPETLRRTNLGKLTVGAAVNMERSLTANGRIGGHFVQGHVDGTGKILAMRHETDSLWV